MIDPIFARNPREVQVLSSKHIAVVGLGSFGSALATMAIRAGVGKLTLVDPDRLTLENVGRHMLSRESVGELKVEAMARALKNIHPGVEVRSIAEDFRKLCPGEFIGTEPPDLLVAATDSFACNALVNGISLACNIPAVYAACWGAADVGEILYVVPNETPCFECYAGFRCVVKNLPVVDERKYTDPDYDDTKMPEQAGLWPNILIICGVAFQFILALLDQDGERAGRLLDPKHTLALVNISGDDSHLQPLAVTFGNVRKGCVICDETKLSELVAEYEV